MEVPKRNVHLFGFLEHGFNRFSWRDRKDVTPHTHKVVYLKLSFNYFGLQKKFVAVLSILRFAR